MRTTLQQLLTEGQELFPAAICEKTGKANPDEPARQDMEHEAAQELFGGYRHLALLAAVSVVLPPEGDLAVGNGDETVIGDGDTMGIAGQVVKHMFRSSEGVLHRPPSPGERVAGGKHGRLSPRPVLGGYPETRVGADERLASSQR